MNLWTNHNIDVNSIKWQSIKAYTYDYIQVSGIPMSRSATLMTPKSLIRDALEWNWSDSLNRINTWTKQKRQTTPHKDNEITKEKTKGKEKYELEGWF